LVRERAFQGRARIPTAAWKPNKDLGHPDRADFEDADAEGLGISGRTVGCGERNPGGNVRVNQDCGFRFQSEQLINGNPVDPTTWWRG